MVGSRLLQLSLGLLLWASVTHSRPVGDEAAALFADDEGERHMANGVAVEYTPEALADRVTYLPGAPSGHHTQLFSGYITVDEEAGRALFYVFVQSTSRPRTDPLVLWLNGGPGCSSLGGGFLAELGPFYPTPGGKQLIPNQFAWNSVANVLYLESPAMVGFSYSNTSADARVGDRRTAADSREFLLRWFDRFPQYRSHKFWLSGESYAGHYVPDLADEILRGNRRDDGEKAINLQGFLVGNAWSDATMDNRAAVDFWWSHGVTSGEATNGMASTCDFSKVGPLLAEEMDSPGALEFWHSHGIISSEARDGALETCDFKSLYPLNSQGGEGQEGDVFVAAVEDPLPMGDKAAKCDRWVNQAMEEMGGINIYDIYADVCLAGPAKVARQLGLMLRNHPAGLSTRHLIQGKYDPCIDSETEAYLNRRDVQLALHANISGQLPGPWTDCTQRIEYSRSDLLSSMLPLYRRLLDEEDIKILVYSGDVDAIVPVIGTRRWIASLDLPRTAPWRAWHSATGQVGGWTVGHGKLTFASVRGAGHMAPYTQPERAHFLFSKWIHQQPL